MKKPFILVVDDDPSILTLIQVNLRVSGYDVATATTLGEASRKVSEASLDLMILDINLPDGSGFDFLASLKADRRTEALPVLILTAMDERRGKIAGFDLGADDYLTKPFDVTELELRVRAILRRASRERTANPLTGLPGNSLIEEELTRRIENGRTRKYAVLYTYVKGFDELRQTQGFAQGDSVAFTIAEVIQDAVKRHGGIDDFVGHREGVDFVIVTTASRAEPLAHSILEGFQTTFGDGLVLAIGIASSEITEFRNTRDITEAGNRARMAASESGNNALAFNKE